MSRQFHSTEQKDSPSTANPYKLHAIEIIVKGMPSFFCKLKLFLLNYWAIFFGCMLSNKLILLARRKKGDASVSNILDT